MIFSVPKPEKRPKTGQKGNPYKDTARRQERTVAKSLGGKRVPLSGGGSIKGDVLSTDVLVECKTGHTLDAAGEKQITLKKDWLIKMAKEAEAEGKAFPVMQLRFKDDKSAWGLMVWEKLLALLNEVQAWRAEAKDATP